MRGGDRLVGPLAASAAAAFLVSVGPDHWSRTVCDTMAINWAAPVVVAGLLMGLAGTVLASERAVPRVVAAAAIAAVAGLMFVLIEPRCLHGPYAMMDPQLNAIWFSHIAEMQSLAQIIHNSPDVAVALTVFPVAAVAAALALLREPAMRRDFAVLLAAAELLVACALTVAAAKMSMYAIWLGMPLVAAIALRLFALFRLEHFAARALAAMLLTPAVLCAAAIAAVQAAGSVPPAGRDGRLAPGCFKTASYAQLARLPRGLVAAETDIGSFVLALTPHSVIAAPYHRLADGIIAAHRIFASLPEEARRILQRHGATYVVLCGKHVPIGMSEAERSAGLWGRIEAGAPPDWLVPVPAEPGDAFTVYRVVQTSGDPARRSGPQQR